MDGEARGWAEVASLRPAVGLQEYERPLCGGPPMATDPPTQRDSGDPASVRGRGLTVTVTDEVEDFPVVLSVTVRVYVVVCIGEAVGCAAEGSLRPSGGDHEYIESDCVGLPRTVVCP